MTASAFASAPARSLFGSANPHALATILEAAETKRIIAATDIFDLQGTKLWARNQPVSQSLQRKLMDRQLRNPLESCLVAEDGVTAVTLTRSLQELVESRSPLGPLLRPHAARLAREAAQLPLHPVAQLLLTAAQAARPAGFAHATEAMALAGALMTAQGGGIAEIRLAMLAGLMHDLGAMYIDPRFSETEAEREPEFTTYQQLVVHPHIGQLLLAQLTHYPATIARAVAEHHERCDGSGYPHAHTTRTLSPLGRLLAVVEASLAALEGGRDHLQHASIALRAVPGEFDLDVVGHVSHAACEQPPLQPVMEEDEIRARLDALASVLTAAESNVARVSAQATHPGLREATALAGWMLGRLRIGWNESGLWSPRAMSSTEAGEVQAMEDELYRRLRGIQRAVYLRTGTLPEAEAGTLRELCESLPMGTA
jgi:hypothetical protein